MNILNIIVYENTTVWSALIKCHNEIKHISGLFFNWTDVWGNYYNIKGRERIVNSTINCVFYIKLFIINIVNIWMTMLMYTCKK